MKIGQHINSCHIVNNNNISYYYYTKFEVIDKFNLIVIPLYRILQLMHIDVDKVICRQLLDIHLWQTHQIVQNGHTNNRTNRSQTNNTKTLRKTTSEPLNRFTYYITGITERPEQIHNNSCNWIIVDKTISLFFLEHLHFRLIVTIRINYCIEKQNDHIFRTAAGQEFQKIF